MKTLNRYYIRMAVVLLALSLGLSSCSDGGGATDPGPPEPEPTPTTITSSFESEDTNFLPGEVQLITIDGTTLTEAEYAAVMNGAEVLLYRYEEDTDNKTLVFIVPEEASQSHELVFTLNEQEQTLDFAIEEYEVIEDPVVFVEDLADEYTSELNAIINQTQEADIADLLQQRKEEMAQNFEEFKALDSDDQALVARIIHSNNNAAAATTAAEFEIQAALSCSEAKSMLNTQIKTVVNSSVVLAAGSVMLGTPAAPLGIIVSGLSVAHLLISLEPLLDAVFDAANVCIFGDEPSLEIGNSATSSSNNQASETGILFSHNEAELFTIKATYDIDEEVTALMNALRETVQQFYSVMPQQWVDTISKTNYVEERTEDPSAYSISSISDDRISSTTGIEGDQLSVTFNYEEERMPTADQNFTFDLGKENNDPAVVEATLQPALPITYDMQVTAAEGESIQGTLKADYAATFTIESDGEHGTVTLLNETTGEFGYDRGSSFTGTDSFTFSATNSSGTSEIATVTIKATGGNEFTYDGQTYPLKWGVILDYGEYFTGFRNFDFILTQETEVYNDVDDSLETFNSDYAIYLWLESSGPDSFDPGTYKFSADTTGNDNFLHDGELSFFDDEEEIAFHIVIDGVVEVSISEDIYTLVFDLILDNDKSLKGSFSYPFRISKVPDGDGNSASGSQSRTNPDKLRFKNK